jgi:ABC-2 type transport system ATP-binding protein
MINSAVEMAGLCVARGGQPVLRDIDAAVREGCITGLLGPSGSGKTTLMRSIIGTQLIAAGTLTVLGRPAGSPSLRTEVGYASQSASVYDDLTVAENLRYFATAVRAQRSDVDRVMEHVRLTAYRNRMTGSLSGGERSRVNLAVAMLGSPRLLVLDEPTVGLDPVLREDLWGLFHELSDSGLTLLVSSHVMDEADRCDELMLLREGRVLTHDTPDGLRRRTGKESLDAAFLTLITGERAA